MTPREAGRYRIPPSAETEFQPGSRGRVLANRLGITRKRDMDRAEHEALLHAQETSVHTIRRSTRFTQQILCDMHCDWLGEIYAWAGQYRTVNLTKSGFTWPPASRVPDNMAGFEREQLSQHTPCKPGTVHNVAHAIAVVHAEFLLIHPFREGNGRLARWLADLMALQAGFPAPQYAFTGPGSRNRQLVYLKAVTEGYVQRYDALDEFFARALERRLATEG